jgi:hypothetical protein
MPMDHEAKQATAGGSDLSEAKRLEWISAVEQILEDPAASEWLKRALREAIARDPVDAINDAEVLYCVMKKRADRILGPE